MAVVRDASLYFKVNVVPLKSRVYPIVASPFELFLKLNEEPTPLISKVATKMFGTLRPHLFSVSTGSPVVGYSVVSSKSIVFRSMLFSTVSRPSVLFTSNFPTRSVAFGMFKMP